MHAKAVLKEKREYSVEHGHPWVFSGAVADVSGNPGPGDTVAVETAHGKMLGWGAYSPASQIRVRMLAYGDAPEPDAAYVSSLVASAVGRRANFWVDGRTNAFRLVHGESDGLPGVTADWYDGWIVVQLSSAGAIRWKDAVTEALAAFVPGARGVFGRGDTDARVREGLDGETATGVLAGAEPPELVEIREGSVRYLVDVRNGHKTGFYLDQRDARATVGALANGAEVLNCFAYTGGFGLAARAAGALSVVQVDSSAAALALARRNEALDHLCGTSFEYVEADVFRQLRLYRDQGRKFDMIVLDPPKFADAKGALMRAARGYKDINLLAMKLLRPNGILATFSCSGAVSSEMFSTICREAAFDAKRRFQTIARTFQGEDHPVRLDFPEGLYLKGLVMRAED